jgi:acyl carrier protein
MLDETALEQLIADVLKVDPELITEDSSCDTIESWDSLRHMNLILALEQSYGVTIPDEDAANITSYALIKRVLQELMVAT